ncbi:MAG: PQQ-binding-like beta-propeller repeat protein [Acidobacteria bacterium]|nr:PQQ-binding-like beta-propeller repeat protein [Acidobacteriota bacterium]
MTTIRRSKPWRYLGPGGLPGLALLLGVLDPAARIGAQSQRAPLSYTSAQADSGELAYVEHCASCHGQNLDDGAYGPPLKGVDFREKWSSSSVEALFTYTSMKMPPTRPGTLGDPAYAQLLAFMLQVNGSRPGTSELPADPEALKAMAPPNWPRIGGGGLAPQVHVPPPPPRVNPLEKIRPVTDSMLIKVPDGEWLAWRRTYDAFGFSPLKKINKTNVSDLRVAWTWSLPNGPNESTPLVHDGVLFIHSYGDKVQALDAATGDLLWQYSRRLPTGIAPSVKRGISIYGGRLYVATSDAHLVALDVKTGRGVWDHAVADPKAGYQMTGGPLVARGRVMIGTMGRAKGGNFVAALDAESGAEAWRFYTIARPGAPGGNSWNGLTLDQRNGASVWIPGSYDPVQNLAFFGTGNTYDTGPLRDLVSERGVTNDGLYLDSTLALDPVTGRLAWHFQHQANGQWDLDWAFERLVVQLPIKGDLQSVVVTAGKQAIFDLLDPETGKYRSSIDLGLQNGVTAIDPKTGAKTVDPALIPGDGQTKMVCPHVSGGRGWMPTSFEPATKIVFVPMVEACMDLVPVAAGERGSLSTGVRWTVRPRPGSDGKYGRLQAINLLTGKTMWTERQRAPFTTGTLVTAGGLVFAGSLDRMFSAYDAATGTQIWKTRLNDVPSSAPISYSANGQEYVSVVVGPGGYQSNSYDALVPEIQNPPDHSAAIWVFELPTKAPVKAAR